ncbi:1,4-beta-N-acetylmuramidase [Corynebacterium glyciniphilum AJ 3170]|uniref:1,4-beta-N-acetylmuramidase n=1 Tax=Corynebacterium glyciniphilum AJ 3170 TaxID=1404245 RepID=X5DNY9_9CORY|nr:peptidoglycan DD-metalloendopeptidase family protein [Corynebacterium glyciniphilum]AHW64888.1 1,4-beta-N-acetylmuramidase [Corynebacterium glyciniphilum AJ 3170]
MRWGDMHAGLDFACPVGTPIYAPADGVVIQGKDRAQGSVNGFGSWIWLDCQESVGKDFIFGHVHHPGILVKAGDRVRAGQQIGVSGNEGRTTGPHVHAEVYGSPGKLGGKHQDPALYFAGATAPGGAKPPPSTGGSSMGTIFGVDVSYFQDGMSLKRAASEGIQFAIIRTTDGTFKDRCYRSHLDDAEGAGLVTAAYHYLRNPSEGTSIAQQVAASLSVMGDAKRPIWLDCENARGLSVEHIKEFKRRFNDAGVHVPGIYTYVPWWEGKVIGGEPDIDQHGLGHVWGAAYGTNPTGAPKSIYPGDNHRQWSYPLGNKKPSMWQFGSNATVAGFEVDINAFKGTKDQVRDLFYDTKAAKPSAPPSTKPKESTVSVNYAHLGLEQLAGSGHKDGEPTFTGWRIDDLITKGRENLRRYGSATVPQMLAIAHEQTFRAIIAEGKQS